MASCSCFILSTIFMSTTLSIEWNFISCPDTSQWIQRAKSLCNTSTPTYFCLFDENNKEYKEFCRKTAEVQKPGFQFVIRGDLDDKKCDTDRFQPIGLSTDGYSRCMFRKSKCNDEGQIQFDNGTTKIDRLCRCDYTISYSFVKTTGDLCSCNPLKEDCTCRKITCAHGQILSPDYNCTELKTFSGTNQCPEIKGKETSNGASDKENELDTNREISAPAVHRKIVVLLVVILVLCLAIAVCSFYKVKDATKNERTVKKLRRERTAHSQTDITQKNVDIQDKNNLSKDVTVTTQKTIDIKEEYSFSKDMSDTSQHNIDNLDGRNLSKDKADFCVNQFDVWKEEDKHVYVTSAMKDVSELLTTKSCVTVIGPPASGKSTIIRHLALQLQEKGYQLIQISSKTCFEEQLNLLKSSESNVRKIFVIDDFCGVDNVDVVAVDAWLSLYNSMEVFNENARNGSVKMLIACRDSIDESSLCQSLSFMTRQVYDMKKKPTTDEEKCNMLEKYTTRETVAKVLPLLKGCNEYFPLFCKIAERIRQINKIEDLFKLKTKYIEKDICDMSDEELISVCACVLFSEFKDDWIQKETRPQHVDNAIKSLQLSILGSKENALPKFSIQTGTYVKKNQNGYSLVHRVIHDIVFVKCNERAPDVFLQFASSRTIANRYRFISIKHDSKNTEIEVSNKREYFQRLKQDLQNGELDSTFYNKQLKYTKYRKQLLLYIDHTNEMKRALKDLKTEKNLLIETAMKGFNDILEMLISIRGKGDINAQDTRGRTALHIAAEKGYNEVAESLLKNGAKLIKDNEGNTPIDKAHFNNKSDMVRKLMNYLDSK